ncbi:MAG: hypothetical protein U5L45_16355 [Saprospiraceae bacterium]|nr:hypothetical protein [Saprospiraceae bacterium]
MEKYINVNRLVNRLTDNEALKTYYTLILMADTQEAKMATDKQFWQSFEMTNPTAKAAIRLAFQEAERNLLAETKRLRQDVTDYQSAIKLKIAA